MIWHSSDIDSVINEVGTNIEKGLFPDEAKARLELDGKNIISDKTDFGPFILLLGKLSQFMTATLIITAIISLISNLIFEENANFIEPIVILLLAVIYSAIGIIENLNFEALLIKMKGEKAPKATLKRNGEILVVNATEVTVGDILILSAGDYIVADARLISCQGLYTDDSVLTNDSVPAEKRADGEPLEDILPIEKRVNMIYAGTRVIAGSCEAVIVATGMETELGRAELIKKEDSSEESSLKARVIVLASRLSVAVAILAISIFTVGLVAILINRENFAARFIELIMSSVSIAFSVLPEFLISATVSVIVAGIKRIRSKNTIIKNLSVLDNLSNISVICCDKTGNLTEEYMAIDTLYTEGKYTEFLTISSPPPPIPANLLTLAALCSDADVSFQNGEPFAIGNPTESAIVKAYAKISGRTRSDLDSTCPRLASLPFDSTRRIMTTLNMIDGNIFAITKGAPEEVISRCISGVDEQAEKAVNELASKGLRVIAVAFRQLENVPLNVISEEIENNLTLCGIIGIKNDLSRDAKNAISICNSAGVRTVMITGDHPLTARFVANKLCILTDDKVITEKEIDEFSEEELSEILKTCSVFARTGSKGKERIVEALKNMGETVLVTADDVEDSSALALADVGCALGQYGTDVVKGRADMTVTDDNYTTIANSVIEGRRVFANIAKSVKFLLLVNLAVITASLLSMIVAGIGYTSPAAILWISMISGFAGVISLSNDIPSEKLLDRAPIGKKEPVIKKKHAIDIVYQGIVNGIVIFISFLLGMLSQNGGFGLAKSLAFVTASICFTLGILSIRSTTKSILDKSILKNKYIFVCLTAEIIILIIVMLTPIRYIFGLEKISSSGWLVTILLAVIPTVIAEGVKLVKGLTALIKEEKQLQ